MPKSKRDKKISLTKTSKKGKALKTHIVDDIRICTEKYERIFLFSTRNMRNIILKRVREEWSDSRFFFGKNKVIALGLGKTPQEEVVEGVHKLAEALRGDCGLLFTNRPKSKVLSWMEEFGEESYARSGFVATETITLPQGPLPEFSHSIEPHLRKLGMPTALERGTVTLLKDYRVCKEGTPLTPEQADILKLFGKQLATFELKPLGYFSKKKKSYERLVSSDDEAEQQMDAEDET